MPDVTIKFPSNVTEEEAIRVKKWIEGIPQTEWQIFKANFEAFKRSFMDVCKAFWHKLVGWLRNLWDRWFN